MGWGTRRRFNKKRIPGTWFKTLRRSLLRKVNKSCKNNCNCTHAGCWKIRRDWCSCKTWRIIPKNSILDTCPNRPLPSWRNSSRYNKMIRRWIDWCGNWPKTMCSWDRRFGRYLGLRLKWTVAVGMWRMQRRRWNRLRVEYRVVISFDWNPIIARLLITIPLKPLSILIYFNPILPSHNPYKT